jgi:fumarate reductase flavoprotein subunit
MKRILIELFLVLGLFFISVVVFAQTAGTGSSKDKKEIISRPVENLQVDVLVIGGGGGGLAAAAAAKEKLRDKGSVLIIEKNSVTGGNSANWPFPVNVSGTATGMQTSGGQNAGANPQAVADAQFEKIVKWNHWRVDAPLVRRLILKSQDTSDWLLGLLSEKEKERILSSPNIRVTPQETRLGNNNYAIVMTRLCRDLGVEILCDTKAVKLLTDKSGAVVGALAEGKNKDLKISAGSVVIATGGFIGNEDLMREFYHPFDENFYDEIFLHGIKHTGDGILMAAEAGAALDATVSFETDFQPISWEVSDVETLRNFINRSGGELIWLDGKGQRFARETDNDSLNSRHSLFHRVYYIVFDEDIKQDIINKKSASGPGGAPAAGGDNGSGPMAGTAGGGMGSATPYDDLDKQFQKQVEKGYAIKADTLENLAKWIGCKPEILKATIKEYNESCEKGYDELLLKPAKSLVPLAKGPYYAIKNKLAIHVTHGPLRVSTDMEVANNNHDPIPGLYAAGSDVGGTENDTYADVPAHSSGWAVAGGRIAGENAAEYSKPKLK